MSAFTLYLFDESTHRFLNETTPCVSCFQSSYFSHYFDFLLPSLYSFLIPLVLFVTKRRVCTGSSRCRHVPRLRTTLKLIYDHLFQFTSLYANSEAIYPRRASRQPTLHPWCQGWWGWTAPPSSTSTWTWICTIDLGRPSSWICLRNIKKTRSSRRIRWVL